MTKIIDKLIKWFIRYIKYNLVGLTTFGIGLTLYYSFLYSFFGEQAYIIVSILGGIIEFTLISYLNKTKYGKMFESCEEK